MNVSGAVEQDELGHDQYCFLSNPPFSARIVKIVLYGLIMVVSLVGNSLIIVLFAKVNMTIKLLVANMAASDLLVPTFLIPRLLTAEIRGSGAFLVAGWPGSVLCKVANFFTDVSVAVSTQTVVLIAAERFVAVVLPEYFTRITIKKRRVFMACTWIIAMLIHSPYFYSYRLGVVQKETVCAYSWEPMFDHQLTHTVYYTVLLVTIVIVPFTLIFILYAVIFCTLKRDKLATQRTRVGKRRRKLRNRKFLKMGVVIVVAFLLCWAPFNVIQFLTLFHPKGIPRCSFTWHIFQQVAVMLALCYCTVNTCICFIFLPRFRHQLHRICTGKRLKLRRKTFCKDSAV